MYALNYVKAKSVKEAAAFLAKNPEAKVLAGGMTLIPTLKQRLVRKKNRKLRRLRELYPDVRIKLFYARDFRAMMLKYGRLGLVQSLSGTPGQVVPERSSPVERAEPDILADAPDHQSVIEAPRPPRRRGRRVDATETEVRR